MSEITDPIGFILFSQVKLQRTLGMESLMSGRILDGLSIPIWISEEFLAVCQKSVSGEGCVHCKECASGIQGRGTIQ